jgi:MarR family transcriptional regulator, organic hydroperoxide resistance regulator
MKKEETIDFHIKWTWHAISRMYNVYAAQKDMTMSIGYVLLNIDAEKGTPATKIGPSIGMEPRSLTRMLKSLEEKGWILRATDKKDKRFVNVFLTELGKKKRDFARDGVIAFNKAIQDDIPENELKMFIKTLDRIKEIVDDQSTHPSEGLMSLELI